MMAPKRKRSTNASDGTPSSSVTTSSKKKRGSKSAAVAASPTPQVPQWEDREYKLKCILDENKRKYLIDWEDDEVTGEKYEPTWEPKENANALAVGEWKQWKAANRNTPRKAAKRKAPGNDGAVPSPSAGPSRKKAKRVIESSEPSTPANRAINGSHEEPEPEIGETQQPPADGASGEDAADSPLFVSEASEKSPPPTAEGALVQLSQPPSSYQYGAYQRFDNSQPLSAAAQSSSAEESSSSAFVPINTSSGRVIPDSDPSSGRSQPQTTQAQSAPTTSQVVPESQSQPLPESSSFQGFSPYPNTGLASSARKQAPQSQRFGDSSPSKNGQRGTASENSSFASTTTSTPRKRRLGGPSLFQNEEQESATSGPTKEAVSFSSTADSVSAGEDLSRRQTQGDLAKAAVVPKTTDTQVTGIVGAVAAQQKDPAQRSRPSAAETAGKTVKLQSPKKTPHTAATGGAVARTEDQTRKSAPVPAQANKQQQPAKPRIGPISTLLNEEGTRSRDGEAVSNSVSEPREPRKTVQAGSQQTENTHQGATEGAPEQEISHATLNTANNASQGVASQSSEQPSAGFITQERPLDEPSTEEDDEIRVNPPPSTERQQPATQEPSQPRQAPAPVVESGSSDEEIRVELPGSADRRRQEAEELLHFARSPVIRSPIVAGNARQSILVESSALQLSSGQFLSQPDYEPPPAGQRPPPSSAPNGPVVSSNRTPRRPSSVAASPLQNRFGQGPSSNLTSSFPPFPPRARQPYTPTHRTQTSPRFRTQLSNPPLLPSGYARPVDPIPSPTRNLGRSAQFFPGRHGQTASSSRSGSARSPESSPFPSVPSTSIGSVGESAPGPIPTLSQMSSQHPMGSRSNVNQTPGRSRAMQTPAGPRQRTPGRMPDQPATSLPANIIAEVAAARQGSPMLDGGRSPSTVPFVEAEPAITQEEMNTSERYDTLLPQAHGSSSDESGNRGRPGVQASSGQHPHPKEPNQDPEAAYAHTVPIVLAGHQRDQYFQNIYFQKRSIDGFLGERRPTEEQITEAEIVIERLRSISMHPDLVNLDTLSQVSTPERQAQWDVDASAKFHFLNVLLGQLEGRNMHVALVASGDRVPDMLETYLQGTHVPYNRNPAARAEFHSANLGLRVSIVNIDQDPATVDGAHLVIAMDGSVDYRHPVIQAARQHPRNGQQMTDTNAWALLLILVVPGTIEHIERCLASGMSRKARAHAILGATRRLKDNAGKAEAGQSFPNPAARTVAEFLSYADAAEWPLAGLSMIEDLDSQTETELDTSVGRNRSKSPGKRPRADISPRSPVDQTKRARVEVPEIPGTINPQDIEVTHVSDSMGKVTQTNLDSTDSGQQELIWPGQQEAQIQLAQYERDLSATQYQVEEQRTEIVAVKKEAAQADYEMNEAFKRLAVFQDTNDKLREEHRTLKAQLEDANRRLLDHSIPERQHFETIRLAAEQARTDKEKAEKKVESLQSEITWLRGMYQDSSSRARDLNEQNGELEARLKRAEEAASGEQARAQQLSQDMRYKALERENKKLRMMLQDREAALKARDEEIMRLRESGRGRMGTRNSSVPRSPRLGSPVARGRGSRQASPNAGDLKPRGGMHPLRNG